MIPILMYHSIKRVSRKEIMRSIHVSPLSFNIQMFLIKILGYRGCSVEEGLKALKSGSNEKLVILTFDDGYRNFFTSALPTLERYGFRATVYVVTDLIGKENQWDADTGISPNDLMNIEELKHCQSKGIEIGCHSATHPKLTDSSTDLHTQVLASKEKLEHELGCPVTAFCYPYGVYDEQVTNYVRLCRFTSATTMNRGIATTADHPLELPRIPINWHTLPHLFLIKLFTGYEDRRRQR